MKTRPGQTLVWNEENQLESVAGESYLYDENGLRIKKTSNGVNTFTPFAHYEVDNGTTVKYYTFNGQRVAMRRGSTLYYLHGDHLGSTALTTTGSGVGTSQTYCAYGKTRSGATCASGNSLATDRQFTGQQYDVTGLHYYNARYYDDHIGQFVSPDSMVPDPATLIDYNRFAYAKANPLKYNDPSGHCSADGSVGDGHKDECWKYVDDIINTWDDTDYWNKRWASKENFLTYVAPTAHNDAEYMMGELNQYWGSDAFKSWKAEQPVPALTSAQLASQADPVCAGEKICQNMVRGAGKVQQKCAEIDCVAIGNDIVGVVATGAVAVGCIPAVAACATATATYGTVATGSTIFGVLWTWNSWSQGGASNTDLTVNLLTAGGGAVTGGLAPAARDLQVIYSVSQLTYDVTPKE